MNHLLTFSDKQVTRDSSKFIKKGHVKIYSRYTGKLLFEGIQKPTREGNNKVIVPGSIAAARKFFYFTEYLVNR